LTRSTWLLLHVVSRCLTCVPLAAKSRVAIEQRSCFVR
jgi:hypothetical protein